MAAFIAISAVSWSLISPTMIISGSCRRKDLKAAANVMPTSSFTGTWLMPLKLNSTGSSAVRILVSSWLSRFRTEYRVVVFPLPVGPVTRIRPYGRLMQRFRPSNVFDSNPSLARSMFRALWSRIRITTLSPKSVGRVDTLKSTDFFLPNFSLIRPSCGTRLSAISSSARILIREITAFLMVVGRFMALYMDPSRRYLT